MKTTIKALLTSLAALAVLALWQNCQGPRAADYSESASMNSPGNGDPYEGKVYVSLALCPDTTPVGKIEYLSVSSAFLMKDNCADINPPTALAAGQFSLNTSDPTRLTYLGRDFILDGTVVPPPPTIPPPQVFSTPGTYSYPAPTVGSAISVQCWGAGGGGASGAGGGTTGGGGGGGGNSIVQVNRASLQANETITVGAGGIGGAAGTGGGTNGATGGASSFGSFLAAGGGLGGMAPSAGSAGGGGGLGSTASGIAGVTGTGGAGGGTGGGAGGSGTGGGNSPGGGGGGTPGSGGGGVAGNGGTLGGAGGNGFCRVTILP